MKNIETVKAEALRLYTLCNEVPGYGDFSFPSWLLSLSDPDKWGSEVLTDEERAQEALDDASYFAKVVANGDHATTAEEIQNGVYELVTHFAE